MTSLSLLVAQQLNKNEGKDTFHEKNLTSHATKQARNIFFEEIHPYFTELFGDYWLSKFGGGDLKCEFSKVWIHSIIGLSKEDIARAIAHHTLTDNAQYPPTALRLRQLAVMTSADHSSIDLKILNANMPRL
ncbi:hypothetical protein [Photobacterium damselae]|uniref:hypothetical protein n=1 Tax=Photobacterium damselae TaxID=38293 RepID=UPI004067DC92